MPRTVQASIDWFRREVVDLDSGQSDRAKTSREYLFEQLRGLRHEYPYPPRMFGFVPYGSFARKTKVRPLDDIDFLAQLDGSGLRVSNFGHTFYLHADNTAPLAEFADSNRAVNSIRVVNRIRDGLGTVANYKKAEIRRNQEVVALSLASYPWTFDIAPAVSVTTTAYYGASPSVAYYLIPDGGGNWKRTNPHLDDDFIRRVNQRHGISVPAAIRLVKFWNARRHKPVLPSYYLETLALRVFEYAPRLETYQSAVEQFFANCPNHLFSACADPKGLGPNLDDGIDWTTKQSVRSKMNEEFSRVRDANVAEYMNRQQAAIAMWGQVFGSEFPAYG